MGDWYTPNTPAIGSGYWARCTYQSGSTVYTGGAGLNVWVQLNSNRTWTFTNSNAGPSVLVGVYRFEISSDSGGLTVLGTKDCTITLEVEGP